MIILGEGVFDLPILGHPRGGYVVRQSGAEDNNLIDEEGNFLVTETGDFIIW
jgi:hypothetical protein